MMTFHRILVPTDFSNCSHSACELATQLATTFGASIDLLHVDEPPPWQGFVIPELISSLPADESTSVHQFVQTRTQRTLEQLVEKLQHAGVTQVRHRMEAGEPREVIVRVAEEEHFDLIVMGTHGRDGLERLVMGSVAESVVRQAQCPVLTVHAHDEASPEGEIVAQPMRTGVP